MDTIYPNIGSHMNGSMENNPVPSILAPAGDKESFLAALAAGADAVYCGLREFSARMGAHNFDLKELARLVQLSHDKGVRVYVAFNSLLKPQELVRAGRLLDQLSRGGGPDGLIIQDLSLLSLVKQVGFQGEIHLSTLANTTFPEALRTIRSDLGVDRVVLPRELDIDEIRSMVQACPEDLGLEVFVHGALCYGVSGRCYWSSYLGGKSGLRGRCVQPCRRKYTQDGRKGTFFSCLDLSFDVLVKILLPMPGIRAWKIEGRKKGPYYVYHAVKAYRLLRDHGSDPEMKKVALDLLSNALGRAVTHYRILSHRPQNPVREDDRLTSGRLIGNTAGSLQKSYFTAREKIFVDDIIRIGCEDDPWHRVMRVSAYVPEKGRFFLKFASTSPPPKGTPVFLVDRRDNELKATIAELEKQLNPLNGWSQKEASFQCKLPRKTTKRSLAIDMRVFRNPQIARPGRTVGFWMPHQESFSVEPAAYSKLWWWIDPAVWPSEEGKIKRSIAHIMNRGGRNFVLNAPWQSRFFEVPRSVNLWAGPFCNITNILAIDVLKKMGFSGVIVSPELEQDDYLSLPVHSPLPLGIVISGNWPVCISRTLSVQLDVRRPFVSPKGEQAWIRQHGMNYWIYPNWKLDIRARRDVLQVAGYVLFVHLFESAPRGVIMKNRPCEWNWQSGLL